MIVMSISLDSSNSIKSSPMGCQNAQSGYSAAIPFSAKPVKEIKLYLDMDGVLTDFSSACERLGEHMMLWFNKDKERFWKRVTSEGPEFWSEMPWMAGGKELYGFLENSGFCPTILSALPGPERGRALAYAREGKVQWLSKELGARYAKNAILCLRPEKALQSGISRVLIDDNSENIREWEEAGGIGILHEDTKSTIQNLSEILEVEQKV
jgi:hypothetical protein